VGKLIGFQNLEEIKYTRFKSKQPELNSNMDRYRNDRCFSLGLLKESHTGKETLESNPDVALSQSLKYTQFLRVCSATVPVNAFLTSEGQSSCVPFVFDQAVTSHTKTMRPCTVSSDLPFLVSHFKQKVQEFSENIDEEFMARIKLSVIPENSRRLNEFFHFSQGHLDSLNDPFLRKKMYFQTKK
jgi:hypothetical protein